MRELLKGLLQRGLPSRIDPIVVSSMGRSGSTVVFDAIVAGLAKERFKLVGGLGGIGRKIVGDALWDFQDAAILPGVVYKTHALAEDWSFGPDAKVVFLFGLASDAAVSVMSCDKRYGGSWTNEHFRHMHADGRLEDLKTRDVLRFEEQIDGWFAQSLVPSISIRYDSLWDHVDDLSDFLGFPVALPPRRQRQSRSDVDDETMGKISQVFERLDAKIMSLPACQVRDAG